MLNVFQGFSRGCTCIKVRRSGHCYKKGRKAIASTGCFRKNNPMIRSASFSIHEEGIQLYVRKLAKLTPCLEDGSQFLVRKFANPAMLGGR